MLRDVKPGYGQHGNTDRLIAAARLISALMVVVVLMIDPGVRGSAAWVVVVAYTYLAVAALGLWWTWSAPVHALAVTVSVHVIEIIVATVLIAGSQTPVSPFIALYLFSLFCATLRFGVRGVVTTGVTLIVLYAGSALLVRDGPLDRAFFLTRIFYLALVATLLAYVRARQQRVQEDLTRLALWPRRTFEERSMVVATSLGFAAELMRVPRAAIVFEEADEPWMWIATRQGSEVSLTREGPDFAVLHVESNASPFFCADAANPETVALIVSGGGVKMHRGCPVDPAVVQRLGMHSVLSVPFVGNETRGHLYFLDVADVSFEGMALSTLVAGHFAATLDEFVLLDRARQAALTEERFRLGRELHDTLVQSLTAMDLQLTHVLSLVREQPDAAIERLQAVRELIGRDHADLRSFIEPLRLGAVPRPAAPLAQRLAELPLWCLQQWGIVLAMNVDPANAPVEEPLATEVYRLVNEAVSNAARHAVASRITVGLSVSSESLELSVSDNGKGFPFHGHFDLDELAALDRGPRMLTDRVRRLGGSLTLASSGAGSVVQMSIPRPA